MRQRDERFAGQARHRQGEVLYDKRASPQPIKLYRPEHFTFHADNTATCPAGRTLTSNGAVYTHSGGAGLCQPPAPQAHEPLHAARQEQGRHAVAAGLPGAQHREDRNQGAMRGN
jgi:hypothetical protein